MKLTDMQVFRNPDGEKLKALLSRPGSYSRDLEKSVGKIMASVKRSGNRSLHKYTRQFDGVGIKKWELSEKELHEGERLLDDELKAAIRQAASNIRTFHEPQMHQEHPIETMPGVECWRKSIPVPVVGLYIPGGSAPLFSTVLMLGIPAQIAGCPERILCTPPDREGKVHPAILFAAQTVGITRIFRVGGVQAIAAMAYGTESLPKVDKIFGPGNAYVTEAKRMAQRDGVAIDMPAGPSEVCVIADETANPAFVAADLLSQAEHGPDSQVLLLTSSFDLAEAVLKQVQDQLLRLPRSSIAAAALEHSRAIVADSVEACMAIANAYAPEHLILACADAERVAEKVVSAGSVFIGHYTPESAGDYASGTNHTLPTNGFARAYSGVSVESFLRKVTFQRITKEGLRLIGPVIKTMAEAEGLQAHAEAVAIRLS